MESILISIRPKWVEKIASGEKAIEVRKTAPKEVPFKAYIYCTKGRAQSRCGKVIGEFICDKVYSIENQGIRFVVADEEQSVTNEIAPSKLPYYDDMVRYLGNKDGYGWHISGLMIYDKPKELSDFSKPCPTKESACLECIVYNEYDEVCANNLTRPPQSWQHIK